MKIILKLFLYIVAGFFIFFAKYDHQVFAKDISANNLAPQSDSIMIAIMNLAENNQDTFYYTKGVKILKNFAKVMSGQDVSEVTQKQWNILFTIMQMADDLIDNAATSKERDNLYLSFGNYLEGNSVSKYSNKTPITFLDPLRKILLTLSKTNYISFMKNLRKLFEITEEIKQTKDPVMLSELTKIEGAYSARLFIDFLPEEYIANINQKKLEYCFDLIGRVGNLLDSLFDMKYDYKSGQIKVKPTLVNKIPLLKLSVIDTLKLANTINNNLYMWRKWAKYMLKMLKNEFKPKSLLPEVNQMVNRSVVPIKLSA